MEEIQERVLTHLPDKLFPHGARAGWWAKLFSLTWKRKAFLHARKPNNSLAPDRVRAKNQGHGMNATLLKAILVLVPVSMLVSYPTVLSRRKAPWSTLQLIGSACLIVVVLAHTCEALRMFPWVGWGAPRSAGHYLDLSSALLGLTLFPTGYLLRAAAKRRADPRRPRAQSSP